LSCIPKASHQSRRSKKDVKSIPIRRSKRITWLGGKKNRRNGVVDIGIETSVEAPSAR